MMTAEDITEKTVSFSEIANDRRPRLASLWPSHLKYLFSRSMMREPPCADPITRCPYFLEFLGRSDLVDFKPSSLWAAVFRCSVCDEVGSSFEVGAFCSGMSSGVFESPFFSPNFGNADVTRSREHLRNINCSHTQCGFAHGSSSNTRCQAAPACQSVVPRPTENPLDLSSSTRS